MLNDKETMKRCDEMENIKSLIEIEKVYYRSLRFAWHH